MTQQQTFSKTNLTFYQVLNLQYKSLQKLIQYCQFSAKMDNQTQMEIQFEAPPMQFQLEFEPLQNQSLVMQQSKLIFPKVDLIIDKNGIKQYSNPQNTLTKFKIIPNNMEEKQVIGRGAAGIVKRAIYNFDGASTVVAIKEIIAFDKEKRDQLLNDLRTFLTGEQSEYLVKFYGCYYHAGAVKQVIEYMNLGSLKNVTNLVSEGKLQINQKQLAELIRRILLGLHYIHRIKHQIHRDIKPENILINDAGQIKITDFGITKYIENTFGQAQTFVGTTIYMSPERIGFQKKYDYKCDIWSLGLILYELATGKQLPYKTSKKEAIIALLNRIVKQNPPSLQGTSRSPELIAFLDLCLQKNPQTRGSVETILKHEWITKNAEQVDLQQLTQRIKMLLNKD